MSLHDPHLNDPFGRTALAPSCLTREDRVRLLLGAAEALSLGEPVVPQASKFLGEALLAWLQIGSEDFDRLLGIRGIPGSHVTVPALVRKITTNGIEGDDRAREVRTFCALKVAEEVQAQ